MKSYAVHYQNKYPGGRVEWSEDKLDAYCSAGQLRVALRKSGAGHWVDRSEEFGAKDRHDLSPIPKNTRVKKLAADDKICEDEKAAERKPYALKASAHACGGVGKVPSCEELKEAGEEMKDDHWKPKAPVRAVYAADPEE